MNGCIGIGVSVRTHIPAIEPDSLNRIVYQILKGEEKLDSLRPAPPGGVGWIDMEPNELKKLNVEGVGVATIGAHVTMEKDDDGTPIVVVSDAPEGLSCGRIKASLELDDLLTDRQVSIRDASSHKTRVIIKRTRRVRRISDEELFERIKKAMTRTIRYQCIFSHGGKAVQMGLIDHLVLATSHALFAHNGFLSKEIGKLDFEIKFCGVRKHLAECLLSDMAPRTILGTPLMKEFEVTGDELKQMMGRSLSSSRQSESVSNQA